MSKASSLQSPPVLVKVPSISLDICSSTPSQLDDLVLRGVGGSGVDLGVLVIAVCVLRTDTGVLFAGVLTPS